MMIKKRIVKKAYSHQKK